MKNKYTARRDYIAKIGNKLIKYLNEGYLIFDEDNELIKNVKLTGFSESSHGLNIDKVIYYDYNPNLDNGYYTSIKEFKKTFGKFKIIHPKHIKRLK